MPIVRAIKWTLILAGILVLSVFALLAVTVIMAGTAAVVYHDEIVEAIPRPVYTYAQEWTATNAHTEVRVDSFEIGPSVRRFNFVGTGEPETGCASIQLTSPSGRPHDFNGRGCDDFGGTLTFSEHGTWRIRYAFAAYSGSVSVGVFAFEDA